MVSLTERDGGVDYKDNNLAGDDGNGTKGTHAGDNGTDPGVTATLDDWAGLVSYSKKSGSSSDAKALTPRIGDTSDGFNQMPVSNGDMHTEGMGIAAVDISTQDGAAEAVQTIKDAICLIFHGSMVSPQPGMR